MRYQFITGANPRVAPSPVAAGSALATAGPNVTGEPRGTDTPCGSAYTSITTASAPGSPFDPNGNAGPHYAGNPGTASAAHANSVHAVAQYDIACFQVTSH